MKTDRISCYTITVCFLVTFSSAPTEIRTPVLAVKGLRPSPLDDEGDKE